MLAFSTTELNIIKCKKGPLHSFFYGSVGVCDAQGKTYVTH